MWFSWIFSWIYIIIIWKLPNSLIGKKRELSSNSSGDKVAAKKQHDESLNDSVGLDKYDAFAQELKSPECVKVLLNCLQILKTKMKNVKEIFCC